MPWQRGALCGRGQRRGVGAMAPSAGVASGRRSRVVNQARCRASLRRRPVYATIAVLSYYSKEPRLNNFGGCPPTPAQSRPTFTKYIKPLHFLSTTTLV